MPTYCRETAPGRFSASRLSRSEWKSSAGFSHGWSNADRHRWSGLSNDSRRLASMAASRCAGISNPVAASSRSMASPPAPQVVNVAEEHHLGSVVHVHAHCPVGVKAERRAQAVEKVAAGKLHSAGKVHGEHGSTAQGQRSIVRSGHRPSRFAIATDYDRLLSATIRSCLDIAVARRYPPPIGLPQRIRVSVHRSMGRRRRCSQAFERRQGLCLPLDRAPTAAGSQGRPPVEVQALRDR